MESPLEKIPGVFGKCKDLIDFFEESNFEAILPNYEEILISKTRNTSNLWTKTNKVLLIDGKKVDFMDLKACFEKSLTTSDSPTLQKEFEEEVNKYGLGGWVRKRLIAVLDEYVLNFHQHIKDSGVDAKVLFGFHDNFYWLGIEDKLGTLSLKIMSKYGLRNYKEEDYNADLDKQGGGLGLYSLVNRGHFFYSKCIWRKESKTIFGIFNDKSYAGKTVIMEES